jgi:predicted dinucleotide-binding enzyme
MKIAIIGSGNVGKALATSSVRGGRSVTMSSKSPDKAAEAGRTDGSW